MPKLAVEGARRRRLLNVRTTDEIRGRLEDASRTSGLPLIDEIERRLERSFLADDLRTLIREEIREEIRAALSEQRAPEVGNHPMRPGYDFLRGPSNWIV